MPDAHVHLSTTASMTVRVTVPDGLDEQEAREAAIEAAYNLAPIDVCAQCAGWDRPWSLDLGEWELDDDDLRGIGPNQLPPGTKTRTEYTTIPDNATAAPKPWPTRGPHHTHQRHIHTTPWTPVTNPPLPPGPHHATLNP